MATDINGRIAAKVRSVLAERGISREDFYAGTGFAERTGARRLTGASSWTTDELGAVADFLDVSLADLVSVSRHEKAVA